MRRLSLFLLSSTLLLCGGATAPADTRITSEERTQFKMGEQSKDTTTEAVLWFGHDRAARILPTGRLISRLDLREAYLVDDAEKSYTVIRMDVAGAGASVPEPKVDRPGETRRIGEWSAERYDLEFEPAPGQTGRTTLWMSTEVDMDLQVYRAYAESVATTMGLGWLKAMASLEGYPVLQETTVGPVHVTTRLVSIVEAAPPANLYDPPAGYARKE